MLKQNHPEHWLGKRVKVKIDRPLGSKHPDYPTSIYPVNYGYIPQTFSPADNEEIDAYVLGPKRPLKDFIGVVIAVVIRKDDEIKLIVTDGTDYSDEEIKRIIDFQEKYHQSTLIRAA